MDKKKAKTMLKQSVCILLALLASMVQAEVTYYHTDIVGSPTVITNKDGAVVSRSHYKPFGDSIEGVQQDVGYTGHQHDAELGLTYMQARYYDPVIGRFYSNDPVGYIGHFQRDNPVHGLNRYTYANNNPYKYIDPDGEFGLIGFFAGGVIEAGMQIGNAMSNGASFGEAASDLNWGSVGAQAALGSVGGFGAKLVGAGLKGTATIGKVTVSLTSKTERVAAGVQGATQVSAAAAGSAGMRGADISDQIVVKMVDAVAGVPVGSVMANKDTIMEVVEESVERVREKLDEE